MSVRLAGIGGCARQSLLLSVTRNDPEKLLPPCFVMALMTPPVKRPYSAETPEVIVVVSWIESSMKRFVWVPRTGSCRLTPLTVMTLSKDAEPLMLGAVAEKLKLTPALRATVER